MASTPSPCTIVRYVGPQHTVLELRVAEDAAVVASTIEQELWEDRREPSMVQMRRNKYGEDLAGYTDEQIATALHSDFPHEDRDQFIAEATQESVTRVIKRGAGLIHVGGDSYLPRGRDVLGIEGC